MTVKCRIQWRRRGPSSLERLAKFLDRLRSLALFTSMGVEFRSLVQEKKPGGKRASDGESEAAAERIA